MVEVPKEFIDALAWQAAKEHPMRIVVADNMVELFLEAYGDAAIIIPLSETMLPAADSPTAPTESRR